MFSFLFYKFVLNDIYPQYNNHLPTVIIIRIYFIRVFRICVVYVCAHDINKLVRL